MCVRKTWWLSRCGICPSVYREHVSGTRQTSVQSQIKYQGGLSCILLPAQSRAQQFSFSQLCLYFAMKWAVHLACFKRHNDDTHSLPGPDWYNFNKLNHIHYHILNNTAIKPSKILSNSPSWDREEFSSLSNMSWMTPSNWLFLSNEIHWLTLRVPCYITLYSLKVHNHLTKCSWQSIHLFYNAKLCTPHITRMFNQVLVIIRTLEPTKQSYMDSRSLTARQHHCPIHHPVQTFCNISHLKYIKHISRHR